MLFPLALLKFSLHLPAGASCSFQMPEEQQPMESKPAAPLRSPGGRRRGRRGGRGRGHGPRRAASVVTAGETAAPLPEEPEIQAGVAGEIAAPAPDAPVSEPSARAETPAKPIQPPIRLHEMPVRPVPSRQKVQPHVPAAVSAPVPPARATKPDGSVIGQTVGEVRQIVESLEQALEQMVEVLRLVELAEHQKFADERELESLRRALHKLQPPQRERREREGN